MKKEKFTLTIIALISSLGAIEAHKFEKKGLPLYLYVNSIISGTRVCSIPTVINGYTSDPALGGQEVTFNGSFSATITPCPTIRLYEIL